MSFMNIPTINVTESLA